MISSEFIDLLRERDRRTVARAISIVENESEKSAELLHALARHKGQAYRIGITGPPGAGKSTLTNELTKFLLTQHKSIAVIAVDPTSPFTGGALLGDRIRMQDVSMNPNVFVRSMATRGSLGGLASKAKDAADVLDAAGFDYVILETVGVGQSELDIAKAADTTVVVLVPESGDAVQAMKSGLMEIADFFVVNKADREGADQAVRALKTILTFRITHADDEWIPNVVKTVASKGEGIDQMFKEIAGHRDYLLRNGLLGKRRAERERERIHELVEEMLQIDFWTAERKQQLETQLEYILAKSQTAFDVARELVADYERQLSVTSVRQPDF